MFNVLFIEVIDGVHDFQLAVSHLRYKLEVLVCSTNTTV